MALRYSTRSPSLIKAILLVGVVGGGKKMLIHVICQEKGASCFWWFGPDASHGPQVNADDGTPPPPAVQSTPDLWRVHPEVNLPLAKVSPVFQDQEEEAMKVASKALRI